MYRMSTYLKSYATPISAKIYIERICPEFVLLMGKHLKHIYSLPHACILFIYLFVCGEDKEHALRGAWHLLSTVAAAFNCVLFFLLFFTIYLDFFSPFRL